MSKAECELIIERSVESLGLCVQAMETVKAALVKHYPNDEPLDSVLSDAVRSLETVRAVVAARFDAELAVMEAANDDDA
ncbi:hypothetical protein [Rhodopirellula europaea]|uniref:hypothetical protein n=1 Tax=Rhodopirellula europaea TaxID=1263866 RepID=UPI003D29C4CE|tara:strand:+ start:10778 stop:11014 length:237 start_codon:yes stop_codon:yes gene_type:complete